MLNRVADKFRGRSVGQVVTLSARTLAESMVGLMPATRARRTAARAADAAFDARWGTDTSTHVGVRDLGFSAERMAQAVHYQPSRTDHLTGPVAAIGIDPAQFHFVDYGAGKGRIVMAAMELGFASVTGVELSAHLCDVARANVARFGAQNPGATPAQILHVDATEYVPAGEHILAYAYNPFGPAVLEPVVRRLEAAVLNGTREVRVIYVQPEHLALFAPAAGWTTERLSDAVAVARLAA